MKYKTHILFVAFFVFALTSVGLTAAYLKTQSETLENQFTVGIITTEIKESPFVEGSIIHKDPKVENTGKNDALIRLRVSISPKEIAEFLEQTKGINYDIENWKLEDDGFWYYQKVLPVGESTPALFTEVKGLTDENGKIIEEFKNLKDFEITFYQEAIQTNINLENGSTLSALDEHGNYNHTNAKELWKHYEGQNN